MVSRNNLLGNIYIQKIINRRIVAYEILINGENNNFIIQQHIPIEPIN